MMRYCLLVVLLGALFTRSGASGAPATKPAEYHFVAGDVIEISVSPQKNFDRTVTVQPDGKISYPIVGQIQASGLTVAQLVEKLGEGLNRELVDPVVSVSLREAGKREVGRVSLLGAVRSSVGFEIREGTTLAEALAAAGGTSPSADLHRVTITHLDGTVTTVDMSQSEKTGRLEGNVKLQPGDIVFVPEGARPSVLVLGEVVKPAPYEIQPDGRLLDAILLAGSMTPEADLRRVTITHSGAVGSQTLNLEPLLKQGDTTNRELNVLLRPGDTIFVPKIEQQIYVLGNVTKPGPYPIKPADRVLNVLMNAGGAGQGVSKAVLVRRDGSGHPVPRNLDLKKILTKGDMNENLLVQPGDMLYVPDKSTRRSPLESLNLLYPFTYLFGLFR
jgi:polysaccharide export outer membrane protein